MIGKLCGVYMDMIIQSGNCFLSDTLNNIVMRKQDFAYNASLKLICAAEMARFSQISKVENPKTGFLVTRLNYCSLAIAMHANVKIMQN